MPFSFDFGGFDPSAFGGFSGLADLELEKDDPLEDVLRITMENQELRMGVLSSMCSTRSR